ncbi:hypothetical protein DPEC_G00375970 [Dallia pectoralis]|nr:hypothetical protein DPEC_G00375970 [Dallia pectoralis]
MAAFSIKRIQWVKDPVFGDEEEPGLRVEIGPDTRFEADPFQGLPTTHLVSTPGDCALRDQSTRLQPLTPHYELSGGVLSRSILAERGDVAQLLTL